MFIVFKWNFFKIYCFSDLIKGFCLEKYKMKGFWVKIMKFLKWKCGKMWVLCGILGM